MDTFDRHFTVKANGDGTFTVVEQFKNGSFVTELSTSPGELCPERTRMSDLLFDLAAAGVFHALDVG